MAKKLSVKCWTLLTPSGMLVMKKKAKMVAEQGRHFGDGSVISMSVKQGAHTIVGARQTEYI